MLIGLALAVAGGITAATSAEAATIQSYSFIQDGYVSEDAGSLATAFVQGSFSGEVAPGGLMNGSGLTDFQMSITIDLGGGPATWHSVGMPSFFSFDTLSAPNASGGNSTLAITASIVTVGKSDLCVGITAVIQCSGSLVNGRYPLFRLSTTEFAKVTAVTPIPAPILLFGTALAGLGLLCRGRSRKLSAA
jgi:hypothetical protein